MMSGQTKPLFLRADSDNIIKIEHANNRVTIWAGHWAGNEIIYTGTLNDFLDDYDSVLLRACLYNEGMNHEMSLAKDNVRSYLNDVKEIAKPPQRSVEDPYQVSIGQVLREADVDINVTEDGIMIMHLGTVINIYKDDAGKAMVDVDVRDDFCEMKAKLMVGSTSGIAHSKEI